jgi:hypothetical protein
MHRKRKALMGRECSNHHIYVEINNHYAGHQSTMVESSGTLNHAKVKIAFDSGATNSFNSPFSLEKCGLESSIMMTLNMLRCILGKIKW